MTREEFHRWMAGQPQGRFELDDGRVVAMAAERIAHTRAGHRAWPARRDAAAAAGVPCEALGDGVSVAVDEWTNCEPDALLNCGEVAAGDAVAAPNPLIVVEATSPSNSRIDLDTKFIGYFRVPSIRHYLIVHVTERVVLHHARRQDGRIGECDPRHRPPCPRPARHRPPDRGPFRGLTRPSPRSGRAAYCSRRDSETA